jgi:flavin reductase
VDGAQAVIICRQALKHKFGTHSIIIGVVEEVRIREAIDPLLYLDGQFVSAKALASATVDRA